MNESLKSPPQQPDQAAKGLPVYYSKGNLFRVIHVDGIYGGPTIAPGEIQMAVFTQRFPYPDMTMQGTNGDEILAERVTKAGLERELEVSLIMNLQTAKSIRDWLERSIKFVEEAMTAATAATAAKLTK
jgi:hypothetical protein